MRGGRLHVNLRMRSPITCAACIAGDLLDALTSTSHVLVNLNTVPGYTQDMLTGTFVRINGVAGRGQV